MSSPAVLVVVIVFNRAVSRPEAREPVQVIASEKKADRQTVIVRSVPDPFAVVELKGL